MESNGSNYMCLVGTFKTTFSSKISKESKFYLYSSRGVCILETKTCLMNEMGLIVQVKALKSLIFQ